MLLRIKYYSINEFFQIKFLFYFKTNDSEFKMIPRSLDRMCYFLICFERQNYDLLMSLDVTLIDCCRLIDLEGFASPIDLPIQRVKN